jgi:hypothetical protein
VLWKERLREAKDELELAYAWFPKGQISRPRLQMVYEDLIQPNESRSFVDGRFLHGESQTTVSMTPANYLVAKFCNFQVTFTAYGGSVRKPGSNRRARSVDVKPTLAKRTEEWNR